MSSADMLILNGERKYSTGVFLNEFYLPYKNLKDQDFEIDFATLDGKSAPIDPESLKLKYWDNEKIQQEAIDFTKLNIKFLNPKSIDSLVKPELEYSGIIIPGGQGLMVDLLGNEKVLKLISMFHTKKKSIGLICHAPAILTTYPNESNPFKGYRVNSVTGIEEWFIETFVMKGNPSVRKIASLLEESGLNYEKSLLPGRPFAVKDRNLVSSQNPFSGKEFIDLYNESLNEFK
ncbi:MAG: thiamine biosynthesis protein ThiJ [Leptospira sp.]|nr:MAG: thiamine biosynthesis protein ThiJ [Leptospira sp.]